MKRIIIFAQYLVTFRYCNSTSDPGKTFQRQILVYHWIVKRRNKITFQGETVLIRVTLYTCTAVTFSTLSEVLHPTTLFILATIKFWVHNARSSSLLPGIFISPYIYAAVVQETNLNIHNWLIVHSTVIVSRDIHHTLIHNLYDKGILHGCFIYLYFRIHEQTGGQVHYCPFTTVLNQEWPHYDHEKNPIVSKKWKLNLFSQAAAFLYLYFCSLINFQHLERKSNYMEVDLRGLIISPADESCWATAHAEA